MFQQLIKIHVSYALLSSLLVGCTATTDGPEVKLEKARLLQARGQFEDAIVLYSEAEKKITEVPDLYFSRGLCYERLQLHERALEDYERCLNLEPAHIDALNNRGVVLASIARYKEAASQFTALLELMPDNVLALRNRGLCYHDQGEFELAMADYDAGIRLAPEDADTWFQRGNLHLQQKNFDLAEADYSKAIELAESHARAWMNRGVARYQRGDVQEGIVDLLQARQLDDNIVIPGIDWIQAGTVTEVVAAKPVIDVELTEDDSATQFAIDHLESLGHDGVNVAVEFPSHSCFKLSSKKDEKPVDVYVAVVSDESQTSAEIPGVVQSDEESEKMLLVIARQSESDSDESDFRVVQLTESWQPDPATLEPVISRVDVP